MEYRNLGRSGLIVSAVGLGCNNFGGRTDRETSVKVIHKSLDMGVTLLDTADMYAERGNSERVLGETLGARRKDIVLATKFAAPMDDEGRLRGASRGYIISAVEASLTRLKTDWIDLYQLHFPDPRTPIEETLRALDDLVRQGKVRYIGCSNLSAWRVTEALWTSKSLGLESFASVQEEYSLIVRDVERDMMPMAEEYGLGILPYFPLASGLLTGKYKRGEPAPAGSRFAISQPLADKCWTDRNAERAEAFRAIAEANGFSLLELAFSWLLSRPQISSVIAGASRPEQIEQNVAAAGRSLDQEMLSAVDEAYKAASG
ncbi:aldo/keto reductase [Microbaculum marinum]|uniref:Aldo/keto reductase n=1 Tax=Microbaculum marinum TaxID=1764581 RepID=A0AAW9RXX5_9HYPH